MFFSGNYPVYVDKHDEFKIPKQFDYLKIFIKSYINVITIKNTFINCGNSPLDAFKFVFEKE